MQADAQVHIHWKGAAEIVLASCTRYMDSNDQLVEMDEEKVRMKLFSSLKWYSARNIL